MFYILVQLNNLLHVLYFINTEQLVAGEPDADQEQHNPDICYRDRLCEPVRAAE